MIRNLTKCFIEPKSQTNVPHKVYLETEILNATYKYCDGDLVRVTGQT